MFDNIVGHKNVKKVLGSMIESGAIPHALLFVGPYGVGKGETALDLARMLLCEHGPESECTTCNACAQECPININHPSLIVDMRRYLVMEEAAGPGELNSMFSNIENNGAPWQFNQQDRMLWAEDIYLNKK